MDSCRDQVLQQIIGPFGLTPAMLDDKRGGNVTTTHNFKKGIVANTEDSKRYDEYKHNLEHSIDRSVYDANLPKKRKQMFQSGEPITSAWTGNDLPHDGRMHLDHVIAVEKIERNPRSNLFMSKEERVAVANSSENLVPAESNINLSMGDKDKEQWAKARSKKEPDKTNAERYGVDMELLQKTKTTSERHLETELFKAQFMKQGQELLVTGTQEATKNGLRQAMGVMLFELVNGSYEEIKRIAKDPALEKNFVDHLIEALRSIGERIKGKLEHVFKAMFSGGIQGFISNLLTYIINNIVTTSAKVVTVIREGLKGLWEAIKLIANPPPGMPAIEVARQATKIIAAVVTASLGIIFEESVKAFLPTLPLSNVISPAVTAILTGIITALVVFGIDRFFDWLGASGTEMLNAQIENMEASAVLLERMAQMLQAQFDNSRQYQLCIEQYRGIETSLAKSQNHISNAAMKAQQAVAKRGATLKMIESGLAELKVMDAELETLLLEYDQNKKG